MKVENQSPEKQSANLTDERSVKSLPDTNNQENCEICKDYPKEYWCGKEKTPAEIEGENQISDEEAYKNGNAEDYR